MNQLAVNPEERRDLYRKSGWQSFYLNAVPYTAIRFAANACFHTGCGPAA